jgi:transcription elongation GreA/GreB family factor
LKNQHLFTLKPCLLYNSKTMKGRRYEKTNEQPPIFATDEAIGAIDGAIGRARGREATQRLAAGRVASHDDVDLHENSQYHMMVSALGPMEKDVDDLVAMRSRLRPGKGQGNFGRRMTVRIESKFDAPAEEEIELVGPAELKVLGVTDPRTGRKRVSYESPIGKALFQGQLRAGTSQSLDLPGGPIKVTIKKVSE